MAVWTALDFTAGEVLTATKLDQMQANFTAMAEGATGAPGITVLSRLKIDKITTTQTWVRPSSSITKVYLIMCGGGGGGRAGTTGTSGNEGGGAGGDAQVLFLHEVTISGDVSVTIGNAGIGGTTAGAAGGNGGSTTFGALATAQGGVGSNSSSGQLSGGKRGGSTGQGAGQGTSYGVGIDWTSSGRGGNGGAGSEFTWVAGSNGEAGICFVLY